MDDLISRQDAIDAVGNMLRRKFGTGGDLAEITLAGLPSAQPEMTDEEKRLVKKLRSYHNGSYAKVIDKLLAVASAQPEQKCETCRYRNLEWSEEPCDSCTMGGKDCHYKPERKKGEWEVIDETEPRRYGCSECKCLSWHMENYCPHCGADMRGEEE